MLIKKEEQNKFKSHKSTDLLKSEMINLSEQLTKSNCFVIILLN